MLLVYIYIALVVYYLPTVVAFARKIERRWDMMVINTAICMLIFLAPLFWLELLGEACIAE